MGDPDIRASLHAGALLTVTGAIAWVTGTPFVFPSLGPTAFVLATTPRAVSSREVIGGHLVGIAAGLVSYHLLASGLVITAASPPLATGQLRLVTSGCLAVALTASGMTATETVHPPACATTLIVSLGLLPSLVDGVIVALAVTLLYATDRVGREFGR